MKTSLFIIGVLVMTLLPCAVQSATLTQQEVIALLQLKTPEAEIIEQVKTGGTTFTLGAEDIARLKRLGATPAILDAMQGAGARGVDLTAAEITDLCLVVDYSGSMNERTPDGMTKMAAAKQAVGKLIDAIPENVNVAVVVYGCDKSRGCDDIDLIQPLGPINKTQLKGRLLSLNNTGMTPIGASLDIAGRALKKAAGGRAIVLVTDGVESCHGNPSGVATKLAAEFGVKFGLHVVGFDIKPEERASLEAIATAGHGKFFNASNAAELTDAMKKVTESVASAPKQRETVKYAAAGDAKKGGVWFDDAPLVQPGEYSGGVAMKEARYYAVPVSKGQEVRVIATIKKSPIEGVLGQQFLLTLYAPNLDEVAAAKQETLTNPVEPITLRVTWTAETDGVAYVCVAASANYTHPNDTDGPIKNKPGPSAYTLKIRAEGEGNTTAALPQVLKVQQGNNFQTAGSIPSSGLVVGDIKSGEAAFYSVPVQKGEHLEIGVASQKPHQPHRGQHHNSSANYTVILYDDDQVEVGKKKFEFDWNWPEAHATALSWPVTLSGKAYLLVTLDEMLDGPKLLPGRLAVLVKKPGSETADASEGQPKPRGKDAFSGAEGTAK